jgi:hypothetical protein
VPISTSYGTMSVQDWTKWTGTSQHMSWRLFVHWIASNSPKLGKKHKCDMHWQCKRWLQLILCIKNMEGTRRTQESAS